jgi:hypothetical protein
MDLREEIKEVLPEPVMRHKVQGAGTWVVELEVRHLRTRNFESCLYEPAQHHTLVLKIGLGLRGSEGDQFLLCFRPIQ